MSSIPPPAPTQTRQIQSGGTAVNPLPPTGLQQQAASTQQQQQQPNTAMPSTLGGQQQQMPGYGSTSLGQLANKLATNYGLSIGRSNNLVDQNGNFMQTPDQVAAASGGRDSSGSAAAKMNLIADALQRQQQMGQEKKSEAALQAGIGLVNQRGRGSLATMQSGLYQNLSSLYQNQQYQAADFSYFIQREQMQIQQDILSRAERLAKKNAQSGFIAGIGIGVLGIATGNVAVAGAGFASAGAQGGSTGWFRHDPDPQLQEAMICG